MFFFFLLALDGNAMADIPCPKQLAEKVSRNFENNIKSRILEFQNYSYEKKIFYHRKHQPSDTFKENTFDNKNIKSLIIHFKEYLLKKSILYYKKQMRLNDTKTEEFYNIITNNINSKISNFTQYSHKKDILYYRTHIQSNDNKTEALYKKITKNIKYVEIIKSYKKIRKQNGSLPHTLTQQELLHYNKIFLKKSGENGKEKSIIQYFKENIFLSTS